LVSPSYFGSDVIWHIPPGHNVDVNTVTRVCFRKNIFKQKFTTALLYKLQRKNGLKSNVDNTKDTSTNIQLLVIWKFDGDYIFCVNLVLIKHSNTITLDENKLERLHSMHRALHNNDHAIEETWLLDDATVLMTTLKWGKVNHAIEITLSKGTRKYDSITPLCVPSNK
jgi:hypothetical protein